MIEAIAAIDHSITLVRRLRDISKNIEAAEFKNLLADLQNELADAKLHIAVLKEQLAAQTEEINALKRAQPAEKEKPIGTLYGCYRSRMMRGCIAPAVTTPEELKPSRIGRTYTSASARCAR